MKLYFTMEHYLFFLSVMVSIAVLIFTNKIYKQKWFFIVLSFFYIINYSFFSSYNMLGRICTDSNNNLYVAATTSTTFSKCKLFLMKLDPNGKLVWSKQAKWLERDYFEINALLTDDYGDLYLVAERKLIKTDPSGKKVWVKSVPLKVQYARNQGDYILLAGTTPKKEIAYRHFHRNGQEVNDMELPEQAAFWDGTGPLCVDPKQNAVYFSKEDKLLVKLDSSGRHVWNRKITEDNVIKMVADREGNIYYITNMAQRAVLTKIDPDGKNQWFRSFSMGKSSEFTAVEDMVINDDNRIYVSGRYSVRTRNGQSSRLNKFLIQFDASGEEMWRKTFRASSNIRDPGALVGDHGQNVLLAMDNPWSNKDDLYIRKISPSGDTIWGCRGFKVGFLWTVWLMVWGLMVSAKNQWLKRREKTQKEWEAYYQQREHDEESPTQ